MQKKDFVVKHYSEANCSNVNNNQSSLDKQEEMSILEIQGLAMTPYLIANIAARNNAPISYGVSEQYPAFEVQPENDSIIGFTKDKQLPYFEAYFRAKSCNPYYLPPFNKYITEKKVEEPIIEVKEEKEKKIKSNKRSLVFFLLLVFSLICIAVPIISSLAIITEYIDIDEDILLVNEISFEDTSLTGIGNTIIDNSALILLTLFGLASVILFVVILIALISNKKIKLFALAFSMLIFAFGFFLLTNSNPRILEELSAELMNLTENYGILAMIAMPVLIILLSFFRYRKVEIN